MLDCACEIAYYSLNADTLDIKGKKCINPVVGPNDRGDTNMVICQEQDARSLGPRCYECNNVQPCYEDTTLVCLFLYKQ
jgi:hypothetical protein